MSRGRNLAIEYRWARGHYDRLPALAADLVGRKVDLIVTSGGTPPARAVKFVSSTIPIVFMGGDPIADGLVSSLARPGGNLTGIVFMTAEMTPKRVELLSELVPQAKVIALLVNPNNPVPEPIMRDVQDSAHAKGLELQLLNAATEGEIDAAFASLVQLRVGGLVLGPDPFLNSRREQLIALAAWRAVPLIYDFRENAAAGGLISYGPSLAAAHRQAGIYAGKILSRQSRNQTGGRRQNSSSAVRAILDDPPIHIRPVCSRKRGCEGQEPCGFNAFQHAHGCTPPPLRPQDSSHVLSRVSS
jgi:putative tryptophan/tyrosine transport system substrate-binding protein